MTSAFFGLQTTLRGLLSHQQAIDTTGHNIANASTVGFSRQEAMLEPTYPYVLPTNSVNNGGGAQLGSGVDVARIRRIRDEFLDLQFRAQESNFGDAAARTNALEQAEGAFAEPTDDGLAAQLGKFWRAWNAVANAPENVGARTALVTSAQTLTATFRAVHAQLSTVAQQAADEYTAITGANGEIANIASELANLNRAIGDAVYRNQQPNDLMDRRDLLLDRLSQLAQVTVTDVGGSRLRVEIGGGTLVDPSTARGYAWPFALTTPGGKLGALTNLSAPTGPVLTYRRDLDAVAADLVARVNALHTATSFFDPAGLTAATIDVLATAATVQTGSTPLPGANDVAQAIARLRGGSTDQAYQALIARIATETEAASSAQRTSQSLLDAIDDRRQSVAGVSLDEEMTNLVRFQRGYQASARAMTTLDEMLDQLINRTGRTGL